MSTRVMSEVLEHSRASGNDRLILMVIADVAHHDGVSYIQVESRTGKKDIVGLANCSRATAMRSLDALVDLAELQVVKVRRGSSFINVYRVQVGRIIGAPVDYSRLPFELPHPFGEGLSLRRSTGQGGAGLDSDPPARHAADPLSQSETVAWSQARGVQGLNDEAVNVSDPASGIAKEGPVLEPSRIRTGDPATDKGEEDRRPGARARLSDRVTGLRLSRQRSTCPECLVGGGRHTTDCRSARETTRQAYARFVDEAAADPDLPLEELRAVVATWHDIDDIDRQELLDRAEALRDPGQTRKAAAA